MTIKARLGLAMGASAVLLLAVGLPGLLGMSRSNDTAYETYVHQLPGAVNIAVANIYAERERTSLDQAALDPGATSVSALFANAAQLRALSRQSMARYLALPREAAEDRLARQLIARRDEMERGLDRFSAAIRSGERTQIVQAAQAASALDVAVALASKALSDFQFGAASERYDRAHHTFIALRTVTIVCLVLALGVAAYSWRALHRRIARPLDTALAHCNRIASGDLSDPVVITSDDEMGRLLAGLSSMRDGLNGTVRRVRARGEAIALAVRQIAAGNLDLSARTGQQAAALEETAASMEQISGTVRQNADHAQHATALAAQASHSAARGNEVVGRVVTTMGAIDDSSRQIAEIVDLIEDIAFQTNILALNASVEAARAGEQGRGFAVVASEVRSLSLRSSNAAKDIKTLIEQSVDRVKAGSGLVGEAGAAMQDILTATRRVGDLIAEISIASSEQSAGIDQVAKAVSQMDEVTQRNAALVEEAASAAQLLESQADELREAVAVFRLADTV